jgi:hypothetical protein
MTKIHEVSELKEETDISNSGIQGLRSWLRLSVFSGPVVRQSIAMRNVRWIKAAYLMASRKQEERGRARAIVPILLQGMPQ